MRKLDANTKTDHSPIFMASCPKADPNMKEPITLLKKQKVLMDILG